MSNLSMTVKQNFDFEKNSIETMDLPTLRRTHHENDIYGNPIRGIYHFKVIETIEEICRKYNLNYQVEEIFAAQNKNKTQPGVVLLPQVEQQLGVRSIEAHVLRRVFTTIRINDFETDELTTTLAIAYHQDGIQVAIGPCVKICHNQCVLSPERSVSDYGKNKVSLETLFATIDSWLSEFETQMTADRAHIKRLKNMVVSPQEILTYIGLLTSLRVAHDSSEKSLSSKVEKYPLNQGQISTFTEEVLKLKLTNQVITAWDLYNIATELYKPGKTDFPALIPQNVAFATTLLEFCEPKAN